MRWAWGARLAAKRSSDPAPAVRRSPRFITRDRPPTAATKVAGAGAPTLAAADSRRRTARAGTRSARYNDPAMASTPDPELFREVFGRFATGVAVITGAGPAGEGGMTANALRSPSLDPP